MNRVFPAGESTSRTGLPGAGCDADTSRLPGVGDLKKVLSNVKTRGILGEVQSAAILRDIMAPEQYGTEVRVRPDSRNVVEFAVKIPSDSGFI